MAHPRLSFENQIHALEQNVVRLGTVVEEMLEASMRALRTEDRELADLTVRKDDIADQLDLDIEQQCIRLLGLQQPLSRDLRTITTVIKIIADLERVGDYSVDIAKTGARIFGQPHFQLPAKLERIGQCVQQIVHDTLRAFVDRDLDLARRICVHDDDVVDELHDTLLEELIQRMQNEPAITPHAARFLLISRYLERIADHCTNIAERIFFMETGHLEELKPKEEDRP